MKPETLESLLIDRAFGELPSNVAELLAAYLAQNPRAALRADELTLTLQHARQAVTLGQKPVLPPLAVGRFGAAAGTAPRAAWLHEGARLAACLVAGAVLGWLVHVSSPAQKDAPEAKVAAGNRLAMRTDLPERSAATASFWSIDALAAAHARNQPAPHYRLRWTSPLTKPTIEEIP